MKSVHKVIKLSMSLAPEILLSSAARERCISNISELPSFNVRGGNPKHTASVLVPVCVDNSEVCLLYTLRSSNLSSHSGQVSFPGGKIDKDETVYDAALREAEEEIGVPAKDINIWTKMNQVQGRDGNMLITPVVGEIMNFDMKKLTPNEGEVADIFTIPMKVFCDTNNHGCYKYNNYAIPVYNGGKHTVWGITGIITHMFLNSFLPKELYCPDFLKKEYKLHELLPAKL
ncbi:nucleoside diphosphate-linked moiety X motif 8-like [Spodoptera litura]|uniref:Nucleoside diphosphate-linked moiety X motif 8-like n=1 Tax=Spodoptera litura TaxID=69820 RepID=A0A9J7E1N3_SPOLT|nr:nucleoside diphosphate-linked moiety X motif 8-like [Spodoptera litura]